MADGSPAAADREGSLKAITPVQFLWYVPTSSACSRMCFCIARSSCAFVERGCKSSEESSAYSLKKYRCGFPGGGHGPPYPICLKSFTPCRVPSGSDSSFAIFSGNARNVGGRFQTTQCTHVPAGASGSSTINARLFVPSGGVDHFRSGEKFSPWHVYCLGIEERSAKAELSIFMFAPLLAIADGIPRGGTKHWMIVDEYRREATVIIPAMKNKAAGHLGFPDIEDKFESREHRCQTGLSRQPQLTPG